MGGHLWERYSGQNVFHRKVQVLNLVALFINLLLLNDMRVGY